MFLSQGRLFTNAVARAMAVVEVDILNPGSLQVRKPKGLERVLFDLESGLLSVESFVKFPRLESDEVDWIGFLAAAGRSAGELGGDIVT